MFVSGLLNENPLQNYLILNTIWNVCPNPYHGHTSLNMAHDDDNVKILSIT
jgi:hypothetical protein